MKFVEQYGLYKIWRFPRKGIYRVSKVNMPGVMVYINHTKDFKSIDEIKAGLQPKVDININYTDPYNVAIQWLRKEENKTDDNYKEIELLVGQYYYGMSAKKELKNKLISKGILTA